MLKKRKVQSLQERVQAIEEELAIKRIGVEVTDHALVRHMERVSGIDVDGIKKQLSEMIQNNYKGGSSVNVEGVSYKIDGNRVITVF